jgi:uncharacterized protein YndB with AHSA1/START domain
VSSTLLVQQWVSATPDLVYRSWTEPAELAAWWWPHIVDTEYHIDAREGGSYKIEAGSLGIGVEGEYVRLVPPSEIVMTWRWLSEGITEPEESVRVLLSPSGHSTEVSVMHELAEQAGPGDDIRQGWTDVLARLAHHHAQP